MEPMHYELKKVVATYRDGSTRTISYKARRWARCVKCDARHLVEVSRHARLRNRPSPCCGAGLRSIRKKG